MKVRSRVAKIASGIRDRLQASHASVTTQLTERGKDVLLAAARYKRDVHGEGIALHGRQIVARPPSSHEVMSDVGFNWSFRECRRRR
jgi:hypothetical protein